MKKKKYLLAIYYIGLICGAFVMNYALINHEGITNQWLDTFLNLGNLKYVKKQELFIYVLYKRLKQTIICGIIYMYVSKIALFIFLLFYGSFIIGLTVSLFVYYEGVSGILYSISIIGPGFILYSFLFYYIFLSFLNNQKYKNSNKNMTVFILIILIIIGVVIEISVINAINPSFFNNK